MNEKPMCLDFIPCESFPVEKTPSPLKSSNVPVTEWSNYLFMGTSIVSGSATALVIRTGSRTEYGRIAGVLTARVLKQNFREVSEDLAI